MRLDECLEVFRIKRESGLAVLVLEESDSQALEFPVELTRLVVGPFAKTMLCVANAAHHLFLA